MTKKHPPPLSCRTRQKLVAPSPSAMLHCGLGLRNRDPKKCKGCTENGDEIWTEGFKEGLEKGMKDPWFKIENNHFIFLRDLTPEEERGLAMCRAIAENFEVLHGIPIEEEAER